MSPVRCRIGLCLLRPHAAARESRFPHSEMVSTWGTADCVPGRATLDDLFEAWIIELRRKGRSPHTVHGYERVYQRNI